MFATRANVDDCSATGVMAEKNWFTTKLQKRLKIASRGLLKKYLRVDYE